MEDTNAAVEPLPLVPAIWIGFKVSNCDGCRILRRKQITDGQDHAHLIANGLKQLDHLCNWKRLALLAQYAHLFHCGKVGLHRIDRLHRSLE